MSQGERKTGGLADRDPWRYVCPECGTTGFEYRTETDHNFWCRKGHTFDVPYDKKKGKQAKMKYDVNPVRRY